MIGGRMATTRLGMETFDHGAQYVTARSKEFKNYLEEVAGLGYAARWNPRAQLNGEEGGGQMLPWYVGTPGMASIVRPLAESVRIHTGRLPYPRHLPVCFLAGSMKFRGHWRASA